MRRLAKSVCKISFLWVMPLFLTSCMMSPRDGQQICETFVFQGFTALPGETVKLWTSGDFPWSGGKRAIANTTSSSSPVYDNAGAAWYHFKQTGVEIPPEAWKLTGGIHAVLWATHGDDHTMYNFSDDTAADCWAVEEYVGMQIIFECAREEETIKVYPDFGCYGLGPSW